MDLSEGESKCRSFGFDRPPWRTIFAQDDRLSVEAKATIDDECLASDEVGARGKEEDGFGHIAGIAVATHGSLGGETNGLQFRPARNGKRNGWDDGVE